MLDDGFAQNNTCLSRYKEMSNELITNHGYTITMVCDGENSFMYTVGRNDKGLTDFVIPQCTQNLFNLISLIVEMDLQGKLPSLNTEVDCDSLMCDKGYTYPHKFLLEEADKAYWSDKAIGIFSRYKADREIKLMKIVIICTDDHSK